MMAWVYLNDNNNTVLLDEKEQCTARVSNPLTFSREFAEEYT